MMRRRPGIVLALALAIGIHATSAQPVPDVADSLDKLLEGAFEINIVARIIDEDQNETVWNMELSRVTISGQAVSVRLDGGNITVVAEFTPYRRARNELVLVAEGQTWIRSGSDGSVEYRTNFSALPITLGEPVVFLPLGAGDVAHEQMPVDTDRYGQLNIELEINVEQYRS